MALFVVSYDLVARKDYPTLTERLEEMNSVRALASMWLVDVDSTAEEVKNNLRGYIDEDDRLMVIEFSERPKWTLALKGTRQWVKARFG